MSESSGFATEEDISTATSDATELLISFFKGIDKKNQGLEFKKETKNLFYQERKKIAKVKTSSRK